jgi:hypothetical protein
VVVGGWGVVSNMAQRPSSLPAAASQQQPRARRMHRRPPAEAGPAAAPGATRQGRSRAALLGSEPPAPAAGAPHTARPQAPGPSSARPPIFTQRAATGTGRVPQKSAFWPASYWLAIYSLVRKARVATALVWGAARALPGAAGGPRALLHL